MLYGVVKLILIYKNSSVHDDRPSDCRSTSYTSASKGKGNFIKERRYK